MVIAGVAAKWDPVWMDKQGNVVTEDKAFGRKCAHDIVHPEMCLVGGPLAHLQNNSWMQGFRFFPLPPIIYLS